MKSKPKREDPEIERTKKDLAALQSQLIKVQKNAAALENELQKAESQIHITEKTLGIKNIHSKQVGKRDKSKEK